MKRFIAVYTDRDDGDWDLTAIFDTEHDSFTEFISQASGANNAAEEYAWGIAECNLGERPWRTQLVEYDDLKQIVDTLTDKPIASPPLGSELSASESAYLMRCPGALESLADYHSWQETMADAVGDMSESVKFHEERREHYTDLAKRHKERIEQGEDWLPEEKSTP